MDDTAQAAIFIGILIALGVCTVAFSSLLSAAFTTTLATTSPFDGWIDSYRSTWLPITLGLVYSLAGVTHFTVADEYKNIYPYPGAWGGLWKLPFSADFHVAWTGVAELVGGIGLLVSGCWHDLAPLSLLTHAGWSSDCAAGLYVLTWAVTPANIFMFTHGAKLPRNVEGEVPISFHVVRFILQVVLLGLLYQLGEGTFQTLFGLLE